MAYLDRILHANRHDSRAFLPFAVAGTRVGLVRPAFAARLCHWPAVFDLTDGTLRLAASLDAPGVSCERRTGAVHEVLCALRAEGLVTGWRDEPYPVTTALSAPPLLLMERAAVPRFGVTGYGVHVNGYVRSRPGVREGMRMWVARRSRSKPTFPGELDQIVAGGQPAGLGLMENVVKECGEEAGIAPALARRAHPVGAIAYCYETPGGLRPDVIYNFDLELPADFVPINTDGEVESFHLLPIEEVAALARDGDEFKFNCSLVVIDFLVRHGFIGPEDPQYLALVRGLQGVLPAPPARC